MKKNTFRFYDTHISIQTDIPEDWELYNSIRRLFKRNKFTFHMEERVKKSYSNIKKFYHEGQKKDLKFHSQIFPLGMDFKFYQDLISDHPHGGRYEFEIFKKMPYVIKLQFIAFRKKLIKLLVDRGYTDITKKYNNVENKLTAIEHIQERIKEVRSYHPCIDPKTQPSYNIKDKDGVILDNGVMRYFYDYDGYLKRGRVYYYLNSTWYVHVNEYDWSVRQAHDFFSTYTPGMPIRKTNREARLKTVLEKSIKHNDFEKAIIIRDLLGIQKTSLAG